MRTLVVQEAQFPQQPALQLIYDTAPIGLAFLSPDCRYLQINQRLIEICGISVERHLGQTVRDCVPGLASAVEAIVHSIMETGEPVTISRSQVNVQIRPRSDFGSRTASAARTGRQYQWGSTLRPKK
jgi:PAS domain-containing protein